MPGLYELLQFLEERNIPKGICTSSAKRVVAEVLSRKELTHRFNFVLTAEDISRGKPDPEIYLKAAGQFGIEVSKMLVLEDSVAGSQAARNAGAFSVVVLAEHNQNGDFSAAHRIVHSLDAADVFTLFSET
jgi:HAD superfamily hydrolase (TIGR01509 family)